jgi:AMP-polyphosphate phosphotransferase
VHVWSIGPPSPEEQGRHYLWRFWQRLPPPGQIAIFDRTWYGRVLVERVEGLARPKEWRRAYDEINAFEKMLVDDGVRLVKLFLHISDEEQFRRFHERITTPTKHWKITPETSATARTGATTSPHAPGQTCRQRCIAYNDGAFY